MRPRAKVRTYCEYGFEDGTVCQSGKAGKAEGRAWWELVFTQWKKGIEYVSENLLLTDYLRKSYEKSIGYKMIDLDLCVEVVSRSCNCITLDVDYLRNR